MYMVTKPKIYDVIVTTNMFGDIITDLGAAIQGGMGMAASGNINPTRQTASMFEPVGGSAEIHRYRQDQSHRRDQRREHDAGAARRSQTAQRVMNAIQKVTGTRKARPQAKSATPRAKLATWCVRCFEHRAATADRGIEHRSVTTRTTVKVPPAKAVSFVQAATSARR